MKKALLAVSFGTSVPAAREAITAVEETLRTAAPEMPFARAFTSSIIRRILEKRGEQVPGVAEALTQLAQNGVEEVFLQPLHILYGNEYDKIRAELAPFKAQFKALHLGRPLLSGTEDLKRLCSALSNAYPAKEDEALVLFGHGTDHFANAAYPALQTAFRLEGRDDVLVGTVEGWPALDDVLSQLDMMSCKQVHIVPMMLVAGDHAMNDMAGDSDSWKAVLEERGYTVRCTMQGLGLMPAVQKMYKERLEQLLDS